MPYISADFDCELILVDDGSHDGTAGYINDICRNQKQAIPVILDENVGTMRGRNEGLKHATGDYVLFLDNDTVWTGDVRNKLIASMERSKSVGVVGMCGIIIPRITQQVHIDHEYFQELQTVNAVTGYCMMIKRVILDKKIVFDENMSVIQGEDIDFCLQCQAAGYSVQAVPNIPLIHTGHGSLASYEDRYQEIIINNMTHMEHKWEGKIELPGNVQLETLFSVLGNPKLKLEKTSQIGKFEFFDVLKN